MFVLDESSNPGRFHPYPDPTVSSSTASGISDATTVSHQPQGEFLTQPQPPRATSAVYNRSTGPIIYGISGPYSYVPNIPDTPASPSSSEDEEDYTLTPL